MADGVNTFGWVARDTSSILSLFEFTRRATGDEDLRLKVLYCGMCHTDLRTIKSKVAWAKFPCVRGHEIVGVVTEVWSKEIKFKAGDKVGVGTFVDSCRSCNQCSNDLEPYCPKLLMTYLSIDYDGSITKGGYSNEMVVKEHFVIPWPETLPLDANAPLLCAGSAVYSPMKFYGLDKPGSHIGIVGLRELGNVAVKFVKAFGAKVTIISTSPSKKDEAINLVGVGYLSHIIYGVAEK